MLFVSDNYSLVFHNGDLQTTTVSFTHNFTQGWLNSYYWFLPALSCLFIYAHVFSLMKVLKVEHSGFLLFENSFATILLIVLRSHTYLSLLLLHCCWWLTCNKLVAFVCAVVDVFVYQPRNSRWYNFSLLFSCEIILGRFYLPNNIKCYNKNSSKTV